MGKETAQFFNSALEILNQAVEGNRYREGEIQQGVEGEKRHTEVVLAWARQIDPQASVALQIAALLHDIDRLITPGEGAGFKGERDSPEYLQHKKDHARRSAEYTQQELSKFGCDPSTLDQITFLILHHDDTRMELEKLNNRELNILVAADGLAFFTTTAIKLREIEGDIRVLDKARFMIGKMPPFALKIINQQHLDDPFLERVKEEVIKELHGTDTQQS